jgi:hypothetical protein
VLYGLARVGYPISADATAMANGVNIPAIFHGRFTGIEEVYVDFRGYTVEVRGVPCYSLGEKVRLERRNKQQRSKSQSQIRIPFSEEMWARLCIYEENAGQAVKLTFSDDDDDDCLSIQFELS